MENDFMKFYSENNISPVRQDISNKKVHLYRREKLYRQLGIPVKTYRMADMLEVGPGGGYNTLAFFEWGVKHIDLVEINNKGIENMNTLFAENCISSDRYTIIKSMIETYESDKRYDIIIAESFLQFVHNQQEIIDILKLYATDNGIIVITCSDEICFFVEQIKRLVAHAITKDIDVYKDKVDYLVKIFEPQLKMLRGVSRPTEDWVQDQLLNPAGVNGASLSLWEAIEMFGDDYDVLGASPNMFTDYSWYKDIWYDYKRDYKKQFCEKNCTLLLANMEEKIIENKAYENLKSKISEIKLYASEYEGTYNSEIINNIIRNINSIIPIFKEIDIRLFNISKECIDVLEVVDNNKEVNLNNYSELFSAFGRTQQYLSMVKKGVYE